MFKRTLRTLLAIGAAQLVPLVPGAVSLLPPPYNLLVAPMLMGLSKGIRNAYPTVPWIKYLPF